MISGLLSVEEKEQFKQRQKKINKLIKAAQEGSDEAKVAIVKLYDRYINKEAYKYVSDINDHADIVQEIKYAVLLSIDEFDFNNGACFNTYLQRLVHNNLIKYRCDFGHEGIRIPYDTYLLMKKIMELENKYIQVKERVPSYSEMLNDLGVSKKRLELALIAKARAKVGSLDGMAKLDKDGNHFSLLSVIASEDREPLAIIIDKMPREAFVKVYNSLSENERKVAELLDHGYTKKEIAELLEKTPKAITGAKNRVATKLKKALIA